MVRERAFIARFILPSTFTNLKLLESLSIRSKGIHRNTRNAGTRSEIRVSILERRNFVFDGAKKNFTANSTMKSPQITNPNFSSIGLSPYTSSTVSKISQINPKNAIGPSNKSSIRANNLFRSFFVSSMLIRFPAQLPNQ